MPRKIRFPTIQYSNVGDIVVADNGKRYKVKRIEGAKVWLKPANSDGTYGPGRSCIGLMVGSTENSILPESAESAIAPLPGP